MTGSWGLLEHSWNLQGRSWRPLGSSWKGLGASRGPLGDVLGRLGRFLGRLGVFQQRSRTRCSARTIFRAQNGSCTIVFAPPKGGKMESKWNPKRVKIQDDLQERISCSSRASWIPLGPILGRLGGHLGLPKSGFVLEILVRDKNSRFFLQR